MISNSLRIIKWGHIYLLTRRNVVYNINSASYFGSVISRFKYPVKNVTFPSTSTCSGARTLTVMNANINNYVPNEIQVRNSSTEITDDTFIQTQHNLFYMLSNSTPVEYMQHFLVKLHDYSGLPWWASIVVSTFIVRTIVTLPLTVYQMHILAKYENVSLEMTEYAQDLHREAVRAQKEKNLTVGQTSYYYQLLVKTKFNELIVRDNCHPLKASLLVWFQIPMWVSISVALRNLAYMLPHNNEAAQIIFLQMSVDGALWFPNLTQPDVSWALPVMLAVLNLSIIEVQGMMRLRKPTRVAKFVTNFFRGFCVVVVPIAANIPSNMVLYWVASSVYGLGQNLVLMSPRVRKLCRIPDTPTTLDHPYQHLADEIRQRIAHLTPKTRRA